MLVVNRFRVPESEGERFRAEVAEAQAALSERPGYLRGSIGRNVDDPELWVLVTTWEDVGAYRRALSSYDVKLRAVAAARSCDRGAERLRGRRTRTPS